MKRIAYVSKVPEDFGKEELGNILRISRPRNKREGISGMLLYHHDSVLQILEGPEENLMTCFNRIARDPRHSCIKQLDERTVNHRAFSDWSMGLADPDTFHTLPRSSLHSFVEIAERLSVAKEIEELPTNTHHVIKTIRQFLSQMNMRGRLNGDGPIFP